MQSMNFSYQLNEIDTVKTVCAKTYGTEEDNNVKTLKFVAITDTPIHEFTYSGKQYKVKVDVESCKFSADALYKDHDVSFDNAVGKIVNHVTMGSENGKPSSIQILVNFYMDIPESKRVYDKYIRGLSKSVSIGLSNYKTKREDETLIYYDGIIHEVSAVWKGRDPNARIIEEFKLDVSNEQKKVYEETPFEYNPTSFSRDTQEKALLLERTQKDLQRLNESVVSLRTHVSNLEDELDILRNNESASEMQQPDAIHAFNINKGCIDMNFSLERVLNGTPTDAELAHYDYVNKHYTLPSEWYASLPEANMFNNNPTKTTDITSIIPQNIHTDKFIEIIKQEARILQYCQVYSNITGSLVRFPVDKTKITPKYIDEGAHDTAQKLTTSQIDITPKTLRATVELTYEAVKNTSLPLKNIVFRSLKKAMRCHLENLIFYGETDKNTKGITNATNGHAADTTLLKVEDNHMIDGSMVLGITSHLAKECIPDEGAIWVGNKVTYNRLKYYSEGTGMGFHANYLIHDDDTMVGKKFVISHMMKDNELIYGDFENLIMCSFGNGFEIRVPDMQDGITRIEAFWQVGIGLTEPKAFVYCKASQ